MSKAENYRYEFLSGVDFHPLHRAYYPKMFSESAFVPAKTFYSDAEKDQLKELDDLLSSAVSLCLVAYDGDNVIGWAWGIQEKYDTYYMKNSAVLPEYRRKGVYSELMKRTIERATELGFQQIYSRHNVSNNAVIIAKLKAGFFISGMDVSDQFGTLVQLSYFPNQGRKDLFMFRAGEKRLAADLAPLLVETVDPA